MAIGNRKYLVMAIFDLISHYSTISKENIVSEMKKLGFEEDSVRSFLDELNVHSMMNLADLSSIDLNKTIGYKPITVTYPAYDNRGIYAKYLFRNATSTIIDDIQEMICSATKIFLILSPYIEEDGLELFGELLKTKLKMNIEAKIISRELTIESPRRDKLISWISMNLSQYPNFSLYDYHYVSSNGHIDSTCHGKVVAVDEKIAYVGSADIRQRAFRLNFEIGTIHTGYVARAISSLLDEIAQVSEKYHP